MAWRGWTKTKKKMAENRIEMLLSISNIQNISKFPLKENTMKKKKEKAEWHDLKKK